MLYNYNKQPINHAINTIHQWAHHSPAISPQATGVIWMGCAFFLFGHSWRQEFKRIGRADHTDRPRTAPRSTGRACAVAAQRNSLSVPKSNLWYLSALYWLVAVAAGLSGVNFYINYYRVYCQRKWSANYTLSGLSHCLPACHKSAHRLHHSLTVSTSDCIASDNACTSVCEYSVFACVCVCVYECVIYKPLALSTIH